MARKSDADEVELVEQIIKQSEKFVCKEITKLKQELNKGTETLRHYELRIQKLEQRINVLEMEKQTLIEEVDTLKKKIDNTNTDGDWKGAIKRAFASALETLTHDNSVQDVSDIYVGPTIPPDPMAFIEITSTPKEDTHLSTQPFRALKVNLGKRKLSEESCATSQLYTDIDSLPDEIKKKLEPFSTKSKCSTREKLNNVQRAFVISKVHELKNTNQKLTETFIQAMITEGVENKIWVEDFKPSSEINFQQIQKRKKNNS